MSVRQQTTTTHDDLFPFREPQQSSTVLRSSQSIVIGQRCKWTVHKKQGLIPLTQTTRTRALPPAHHDPKDGTTKNTSVNQQQQQQQPKGLLENSNSDVDSESLSLHPAFQGCDNEKTPAPNKQKKFQERLENFVKVTSKGDADASTDSVGSNKTTMEANVLGSSPGVESADSTDLPSHPGSKVVGNDDKKIPGQKEEATKSVERRTPWTKEEDLRLVKEVENILPASNESASVINLTLDDCLEIIHQKYFSSKHTLHSLKERYEVVKGRKHYPNQKGQQRLQDTLQRKRQNHLLCVATTKTISKKNKHNKGAEHRNHYQQWTKGEGDLLVREIEQFFCNSNSNVNLPLGQCIDIVHQKHFASKRTRPAVAQRYHMLKAQPDHHHQMKQYHVREWSQKKKSLRSNKKEHEESGETVMYSTFKARAQEAKCHMSPWTEEEDDLLFKNVNALLLKNESINSGAKIVYKEHFASKRTLQATKQRYHILLKKYQNSLKVEQERRASTAQKEQSGKSLSNGFFPTQDGTINNEPHTSNESNSSLSPAFASCSASATATLTTSNSDCSQQSNKNNISSRILEPSSLEKDHQQPLDNGESTEQFPFAIGDKQEREGDHLCDTRTSNPVSRSTGTNVEEVLSGITTANAGIIQTDSTHSRSTGHAGNTSDATTVAELWSIGENGTSAFI